jgi:hypothetical protein
MQSAVRDSGSVGFQKETIEPLSRTALVFGEGASSEI